MQNATMGPDRHTMIIRQILIRTSASNGEPSTSKPTSLQLPLQLFCPISTTNPAQLPKHPLGLRALKLATRPKNTPIVLMQIFQLYCHDLGLLVKIRLHHLDLAIRRSHLMARNTHTNNQENKPRLQSEPCSCTKTIVLCDPLRPLDPRTPSPPNQDHHQAWLCLSDASCPHKQPHH